MADHPITDAALLERFVSRREEAAFAALMRRHVPGVRAACRRILQSEHDTEDVVQATFLVLALRAAEVPWRDSVGGWLRGVARRLSLDARAGVSRRRRRETPLAALAGALPETLHPLTDPPAELDRRELRRVLDDELSRLPEKFRAPVVLCDLEGLSHSEAARRLGWPSGSMSRRLGRARAILRHRLAGRGLPVAVVVLCGLVAGLWAAGRGSGSGSPAVSVRRQMTPPARHDGGGLDLGGILAGLGRGDDSPALRGRAAAVSRDLTRVAGRLEGVDPGRDREAWRSFAVNLQASAVAMTRAARDSDDRSLLLAVQRADASCVGCHLAFRQREATPDD